MGVILTFLCSCVRPRRYLAVLRLAIPPPRIMMCSAEDVMLLEANFCSVAAADAAAAAEDRDIDTATDNGPYLMIGL